MLKIKKVNKKFYNKWCYKTTLYVPGIAILRMYKNTNMESLFLNNNPRPIISTENKAWNNKDLIIVLDSFLSALDKNAWAKRIERDYIDLYTNDKNIYDDINLIFKDCIHKSYIPDPNMDLENDNIIRVKKLPHSKYQYKVFLLPHKMKNISDKKSYLEWVQKQSGIKISNSVVHWFINTSWNWDRRYIWVEDKNSLLLLNLRNSEVCGRTYEYQIIDK